MKRILIIAGVALGVVLWLTGLNLNSWSGTGGTSGTPLVTIGILLMLSPILWGVLALARQLVSDVVKGGKAYAAWRKTLTPEQLNALRIAEAAALVVAQHEVHKHLNSPKEVARRERIHNQIMHGSGSNPWSGSF